MAKQSVATIKSWFQTGDKPTQAQFWDWLESFIHKDDPITTSQVTGLNTTLSTLATQASVDALKGTVLSASASTFSTSIAAGTILHVLRIKSTSAITFNLGTSVGGSQILAAESLGVGEVGVYTLDRDFETLQTIYFSGLAGTTSIKIYLLQ